MKLLAHSLLAIALSWFCLSIYSLFWPSTSARIIDSSKVSISQNGYTGVSRPSISNFTGGITNINLVRYSYKVADTTYDATGIVPPTGSNYMKVYYCPLLPSFSLTSNSIPLIWLILLFVLALGLLAIHKWLSDQIQKKCVPTD